MQHTLCFSYVSEKCVERICFHFAIQRIRLYSISVVLKVDKLIQPLKSNSYIITHSDSWVTQLIVRLLKLSAWLPLRLPELS